MTANPDIPDRAIARLEARFRQAARPALERIGEYAAAKRSRDLAAVHDEVELLRDELDRTRRELQAEIALLRAELASRDQVDPC